jgi:hypothetical protein
MKSILRRRPSPAMIVALIALFVALGGSVYAAGRLSGESIKKRSLPGNRIVKNDVTGKEVKESALGKVPNARTLGGIRPTAFSRVARSATDANAIPIPSGGSGTARTVGIRAPQDGFLMAVASASVFNENDSDNYRCFVNLDGNDQSQSIRLGKLTFDSANQEICDTNAVLPVPKGSHRVRFKFDDLDNTTVVDAAELDVVFVPFKG